MPDGTMSDTVVVHMPSAVKRHGVADSGELPAGIAVVGLAEADADDAGAGDAGSTAATLRFLAALWCARA